MLALKGNQGGLHEDVQYCFDAAHPRQFEGIAHRYHETLDADHGHLEIRRYRWV